MKQRVLVLGAGGFIGRRVVAALEASFWATPIAVGHHTPLPKGLAERVWLDAADEPALARAVEATDAVVNCIAGSADTLRTTARVLFAVVHRVPHRPRVVHLSSMAVYGAAAGTVDETAPVRADGGAYASAKVEAERLAATCANVVTLRPGCVYGPGSVQWSERIASWLTARRVGDLGAAGDGTCNLAYVDDVVVAILAALQRPRVGGEAFNLGSPAPPTWNEYFISFARALGAVPVRRISQRQLTLETRLWAPPLKAAELAARFARLDRVRIPPPIPPSLLRSWSQEIRLDVSKAQAVLGVAWTPTDVGLRETVRALGMA